MIFIFLIASYFLGSLPFGYWLVRLKTGQDIRELGSKNPGATNVGRVLGRKFGILVLILDALKGVIPPFCAGLFFPLENLIQIELICGSLAIIGHIYSPFLFFKGGKGVATALGLFLYIATIPCLVSVLLFLISYKLSGYVSIGSVIGSLFLPIIYACINWMNIFKLRPEEISVLATMVFASVFILFRHIPNIKRLLTGQELKAVE